MQGKGIIKFFAILLAVVCLYQLSFTWVANRVENNARDYAKGNGLKEKMYLDSMSTQPVYPGFGYNYQYVKNQALALGLDLKGGMDVTMQISLAELVKSLADNNPDAALNQALAGAENLSRTSSTDYITLFVNEYERINPNGKLAALFATKENKDLKYNSSNGEVKTYLQDKAKAAVADSYTVLHTRVDQFGVANANIQVQPGTNKILIELPGVSDKERVRKLLQGSAKLEFYETFENAEFYQVLINIDKLLGAKAKIAKADTGKTSAAANTTAANAAVKTGATTAASKSSSDTSKSGLSLLNKVNKGAGDSSKLNKKNPLAASNPLLSVLQLATYPGQNGQQELRPGPVVAYASQKDTARINALLNSTEAKSVMPRNAKLLWGVKALEKKIYELYAVKLSGAENGPALAGDVISDARSDIDQKGSPEVVMIMNPDGATKWARITTEVSQQKAGPGGVPGSVAIVLDNYVYSAPSVKDPITGGISSISGSFTVDETRDLANVLKSGRLPAPARIVQEEVVGASLGQEAINSGLMSSAVGLLVVLVFMIAYYNRAGTVAIVAVIVNVFFLMGILASLHAVLTLEGIAGIVLTLGIAVDANVLIYERIREEIALGKSFRISVADGFKHALWSILDSNISTFLTGLILYVFGSGPIKGFAITLMIGIVTSLFCSILISRLIFEWMMNKEMDIKFSNPWSSHTFKNANYAFVKNRFRFYAFSGIFILAGIISMVTRGFNYGVDFQGGRTYVVRFDQSVSTQAVRDALDQTLTKNTEVKTFGSNGDQVRVTTNYLIDENSGNAENKVEAKLKQGLAQVPGHGTIMSSQKVGPTIASDLKKSAIYAVIFAIIIISAYILIRFRKWQFSLGAMIATAHDALLVLSFFSLFKDLLPFVDIDQKFIAAILTVIGYSINDTVVVFDRIREFLRMRTGNENQDEVINRAINSTLSRTIITALTVLFVLLVLFIFGGEVLRGFSFALLIGVCFGTYSSICVATPVIVDFGKKDLR
jgi:SecD/SecF fusion protein